MIGATTSTLGLATGIANIYNRAPGVMLQGANTVAEAINTLKTGVLLPGDYKVEASSTASPTRS